MANSVESILPAHIRKTFEQFGVIKPAAWPKLDTLVKAITGRKYRYDLQTSQDGTATARVFAQGVTYTGVDGEPERALAHAFHQCLKEQGSNQLGMFEEDDPDDEEDESPTPWQPDKRYDPIRTITDARMVDINASHEPPTPPSEPVRSTRSTLRNPDGETFTLDPERDDYISAEGVILDPLEAAQLMAKARV